ncbi:MAG: serine/threonine protein kinase [Rhodothermales bacterium]|nr:serine/threonine protein kinase [Rhodothermales bacterium]
MKTENISKLFQIVEAAMNVEEARRAAVIEELCGSNMELREEAWRMIEADKTAPEFMAEPASEASHVIESISAREAPIGDTAPATIGPYRNARLIGRGGMGNVYHAIQTLGKVERPVAVKVVKKGMDTDAFVARFNAERNILASLSHTNIARLVDVGSTETGQAFFAMEYVDGLSLKEYADSNKLSLDERLDLFVIICKAVHHAHQQLIVHRDLKPSNILVTEEGEIKLLDFGIAKLLDDRNSLYTVPATAAGQVLVTPEYASPEQLAGGPVSTSTDVYSLGVVLFELLAGTLPFGSARHSRLDYLRKRNTDEVRKPSAALGDTAHIDLENITSARKTSSVQLIKQLSGELDTIVLKAMRHSPEDRYASVEQLREDIERYRNGIPIQARPATLSYTMRKFVTRNKVSVATACISLLILAMLTLAYIARLSGERETSRRAAVRAENVTEFVVEILEQGVDTRGPDSDEYVKTVLSMLDNASEKLESLEDDPESSVAILTSIARVMTGLGAKDRAIEFGHKARSIPIESAELKAGVLLGLAQAHFHVARYDSAFNYADEAYNLYMQADNPPLASILASQKYRAWSSPTVVGHTDYVDETIAEYEKVYGPESVEVAEVLNDLGQGNAEDGEAHFRRALKIYEETIGVENEMAAAVMANLSLAVEAEDSTYALALQVRARDAFEKSIGELHPRTLTTMSNIGAMYVERRRYLEADEIFTETYQRRRSLDPGGEIRSPISSYWFALAKLGLDQPSEAAGILEPEVLSLTVDDYRYLPLAQVYLLALRRADQRSRALAYVDRLEGELRDQFDDRAVDNLYAIINRK